MTKFFHISVITLSLMMGAFAIGDTMDPKNELKSPVTRVQAEIDELKASLKLLENEDKDSALAGITRNLIKEETALLSEIERDELSAEEVESRLEKIHSENNPIGGGGGLFS